MHFTMSPQLVLLHYLAKRGNTKIAFFTQMPEFNQLLLDFFNIFRLSRGNAKALDK